MDNPTYSVLRNNIFTTITNSSMISLIFQYIKTQGFLSLLSMLSNRFLFSFSPYRFFLYWRKYPTCRITTDSILHDITCGKRVAIWGTVISNSTIGDGTYMGGMGGSMSNVDIGKYCSIAAGVKIPPKGTVNRILPPSTYPFYNAILSPFFNPNWLKDEPIERTIIGNDVFIGTNAIILGGVTIGNGAVIGAGTIVTEDVPPYTIFIGVPGKVIRNRFNEETTSYLQNLQWWDKSDDEIKELLPYLTNPIQKI